MLALASFLVFGFLYSGAALVGDHLPWRFRWYFSWEQQIPLVPEASLVYLSISLMLIPLLRYLPTFQLLWPLSLTLAWQQALAALCFLLFPLEDGYPPAAEVHGPAGWVWRLANRLALRHNYFPSLHVALSCTAVLVISRRLGRLHRPMALWAAAIALSTLLIHQHHLVDVLAGMALAWLSVRMVYDRKAPT